MKEEEIWAKVPRKEKERKMRDEWKLRENIWWEEKEKIADMKEKQKTKYERINHEEKERNGEMWENLRECG